MRTLREKRRGVDGDIVRRVSDPVGSEPDARFSFANERTLLAWNRTALALIVAGVGLAGVFRSVDASIVAIPLVALGAILAIGGYRRWQDADRALRLGEPLPPTNLPVILAIGVVVISATAVVLIFVHWPS